MSELQLKAGLLVELRDGHTARIMDRLSDCPFSGLQPNYRWFGWRDDSRPMWWTEDGRWQHNGHYPNDRDIVGVIDEDSDSVCRNPWTRVCGVVWALCGAARVARDLDSMYPAR